MKFSIITPSFNQLDYLKRCVASVADQEGVDVEHIVMDGGSTDGTVEWLERYTQEIRDQRSKSSRQCEGPNAQQPVTNNYQLTFMSEADDGMYDALNKGFSRASGDIFAWLNCDEQYLEGTLSFVQDWFSKESRADLLSGSAVLIEPDGSLIAYRKAYALRPNYISTSHLYNLSCGLFFRRRTWASGIHFNSSYRNLGDQEWMLRLLQDGVRARYTRRFLSAFSFTGRNLSQSETARDEARRLVDQLPSIVRGLRIPINLFRWMEKALSGSYCQPPFDYAVYPDAEADRRETFQVEKASFRWPKK